MSNLTINTVVVKGKEVELVSGKANFGSPDYYEYVPGYMTTSGAGEVDSRFATTGFFKDADGNTVKIRLNLWGEEADLAKKVLMDSRRVATIMVKNARLTHYTDRTGVARRSASINFKSQYEVLEVKDHNKSFADFLNEAEAANDVEAQASNEYGQYTDAPF